ncbi:MAG: GNAT family N-acetyltransferase [Planctomycetota bacterium]|jgi:RimJ/RimL family protein N-acetyltransferase
MPTYFLESKRLWFRAREESDAAFFTEILQAPDVRRHLGIGRFPFNEAGERKFLEAGNEPPVVDAASDVALVFGIKGEEKPLGSGGLHRINWLNRHAEWGIVIGRPDEWGKGYGREVAKTMLGYAFKTLNLHRVYLRVDADNEKGIRSYKAAGFTHEGTSREVVFIDGSYRDQHIMSILAHEWEST